MYAHNNSCHIIHLQLTFYVLFLIKTKQLWTESDKASEVTDHHTEIFRHERISAHSAEKMYMLGVFFPRKPRIDFQQIYISEYSYNA